MRVRWSFLTAVTCAVCLVGIVEATQAADPTAQRVRRLNLKRDEIAQVKTALGIATLIQVPDRPTSVVLGDTNAFKVEYLESAITIKPLSHSSKSNLYIYTEGRRFNVSLTTTPLPSADYIVYLEGDRKLPEPTPTPIMERWRPYVTEKSSPDFQVRTSRVGTAGDFLLVEFYISSQAVAAFRPDWIWLTQRGRTIPIHRLSLSAVESAPEKPIQGFIIVRRSDASTGAPLVLEVRAPKPIKLKLPEVNAWLKSS